MLIVRLKRDRDYVRGLSSNHFQTIFSHIRGVLLYTTIDKRIGHPVRSTIHKLLIDLLITLNRADRHSVEYEPVAVSRVSWVALSAALSGNGVAQSICGKGAEAFGAIKEGASSFFRMRRASSLARLVLEPQVERREPRVRRQI